MYAFKANMPSRRGFIGYGINEQLYLEVLNPTDVAYTYKIREARDFGEVLAQPLRNVQLVATEPSEACGQLIDNGNLLLNQVALVERGYVCGLMVNDFLRSSSL